jgi:hypothetical protein
MKAKEGIEAARADLQRGWGVSFQNLLVAALVVLPFSFTLGILIGQATWWPSTVLILLTGLFQGIGTFWLAGFRRRRGLSDESGQSS